MLGFQGGTFTIESQFGKVPDDFIMDDVRCEGTERDIRFETSSCTEYCININSNL